MLAFLSLFVGLLLPLANDEMVNERITATMDNSSPPSAGYFLHTSEILTYCNQALSRVMELR